MDFHPTDVKVRISGDQTAGLALMSEAKNLLSRAILLFNQTGGPVQLRDSSPRGDISVLLHGTLKLINIVPVVPEPAPPEVPTGLFVLCGEILGGTVHVDSGTGKRYLRKYRPTVATATSHNIPNIFHDNERLCPPTGADGSDTAYATIKASYFTGSMKRVVQAVQGLGKISDKSGSYITAAPITRYVTMQYESSADKSHGIVKTGPKNHWLVEISSTNGILAMPLPLIPSTRGAKYRGYLNRIGDLGGLEIVDEFGGLPSGETFPIGTPLFDAITVGKILRIMDATDIAAFYAGSRLPSFDPSWAFSETTGVARSTRVLKRYLQPGDPLPSVVAEHWEILISLTSHDLSAIARHEPVGVGAASINEIGAGRLSRWACRTLWAQQVSGDALSPLLEAYLPEFLANQLMDTPYTSNDVGDEHIGWGAVVYSFFDGDRPQTMRWVPGVYIAEGGNLLDYEIFTDEFIPPAGFTVTHYASSQVWSPAAYVGSDLDLRETVNLYYPWNTVTRTWNDVSMFDPEGFSSGSFVATSPPFRNCFIWGILPAFAREAYAIGRFTTTEDATEVVIVPPGQPYEVISTEPTNPNEFGDTTAYISGIGLISLATDDAINVPFSPAQLYCGTVYNGAQRSSGGLARQVKYVITENFEYNMPPPVTYQRVGLLAGAEAAIPRTTNFIGSMREA